MSCGFYIKVMKFYSNIYQKVSNKLVVAINTINCSLAIAQNQGSTKSSKT